MPDPLDIPFCSDTLRASFLSYPNTLATEFFPDFSTPFITNQ
jgi:hypothetical protein